MDYNIPEKIIEMVTKVQIVPRGTICNFITYHELLEKWNLRINLVSKSTMNDFWNRHLLDSLQIYRYIEQPEHQKVVDLGSGAGFPGMVLAIAGVKNMSLIESDSRKCAFIREVATKTGTIVKIHNCRIEKFQEKADVITARALAPMPQLIDYAKNIINPNGKIILLKGQAWAAELAAAAEHLQKLNWQASAAESVTDPKSRIIKIDATKK